MFWNTSIQKSIIPVLFLLFFIPLSSQAQEFDETEVLFGAGDIAMYTTASELASLAQEQGTVRVIVNLDIGFEQDVVFDESSIEEQMKIIQVAQKELIDELSGVLDIAEDPPHSFKYVPALAMTVDSDTLEFLQSSSMVSSIVEDVAVFPTLARSIPVIGADKAWDLGYSGNGQTIAVLDTGVDNSHPMFAGNKIVDEACYSSNVATQSATSLCPNGSNQQISSGAAAPCAGICSHGTHVAGIAAGSKVFSGPTISYEGVAKDSDIIAVQVFSKFNSASQCDPFNRGWAIPCVKSYNSDQIKGLEHIFDLRNTYNISSVNLSLGGSKYTSTCDTVIPIYKNIIDNLRSVGIASIFASGNDGYTDGISFPACISTAISVGATDNNDVIASFSNNDDTLDLLAPGVSIRSAVPGGGLGYKGGTSMAAPHVTGAWAVAKSALPTASVQDILDSFKTTGVDVTDNRPGSTGASYKRIQLDSAICDLITCPIPTPTPTPTPIPTPTPTPTPTPGGCLIATATYGTELAPQVQFLREIRDNTVMSTASGAAFMTGFNQLYYSFSPYIADIERENPMVQEAVRALITPMISTLSIMTLAEDGSEVEVLGLGISVIALNLGMYIAAPAIVVWQIKKRI